VCTDGLGDDPAPFPGLVTALVMQFEVPNGSWVQVRVKVSGGNWLWMEPGLVQQSGDRLR